jgi:predicted transcriptional regulator
LDKVRYWRSSRYELPCEHAAKVVFPSIRASIARVLLKEYGVSKYTIAKILGTTPAAVSFYLEGRRGDRYVRRIEETPELASIVRSVARTLLESYSSRGSVEYSLHQVAFCSICSKVNELAVNHGCPATLFESKLIS